MKEKISSIKKLKHYLDILTSEFGNHTDLNKSSPKYNYYNGSYSKGVESDYIRIYKMGTIGKLYFSFALSFTNPEDSEKSLIQMTYKLGDDVFAGKIYNYEAFKEKLKEFINTVTILKEIKSKSPEAIKTSIYRIFEFDKQKLNEEEILKECQNKIKESINSIEEEEAKLNKTLKKVSQKFITSKKSITDFTDARVKELGIDIMEKELKALKDMVAKEVKEKEQKLSIKNLQSEESTLKYKLREIDYKKQGEIQKIIKTYPSHIQKMILEKKK